MANYQLKEIIGDNPAGINLTDIFGNYNPGAPFGTNLTNILTGDSIVAKAISAALDIAGALVVIMLMYSGYLYITAYGEEGKLTSAKNTLIWSIVGAIIVGSSQIFIILAKQAVK